LGIFVGFPDFPYVVIGSATAPEVWGPMDFHQISVKILTKMLEGTKEVHKTIAK